MSEYETIKAETRGAVRLLTLNRPDKLNAWVPQMFVDLIHAIEAANDDRSVGAIVITGEGRGFCTRQKLARANTRTHQTTRVSRDNPNSSMRCT